MQDQRDDSIIGVRSTARHFGDKPRRWLALFAAVTLLCWTLAGVLAHLQPIYYAGVAAIALHFAWQIIFVKPDDPADCLAKFKSNAQVGLLLTAAIVAAHLL
jgi:4-hydroxybenzoate polyprenyltransferase